MNTLDVAMHAGIFHSEVFMKRAISAAVLGFVSLALSGAMIGCSASADVDPNHGHVSSRTTTVDNTGTASYKKTTYRDANGNVVEQKVEKHND
jgi:hypothetical protein